ncbi:MAG: permease-like cell division protein FtsX [Gallionellaceae bacterium]
MKSWLTQHIQVLFFTLRRQFANFGAGLLNILVIGIALSLPTGAYVLLQNVQDLAARVIGAPQISIFMDMDSSKDDIARIEQRLKQHDAEIDHTEFVARDRALELLKHTTGLTDVIGGLAQNPLPDAFVVYPKQSGPQSLEALRNEFSQWPKVEHVQLDSAWARKLEALLKFGKTAILILALLLSFALVAVTFNTIRLQILTQRVEIEVSKLIGATNSFIRRPFLYFGTMQGLLGGVAAWAIVAASVLVLNGSLFDVTQQYASGFVLQPLSAQDGLSLLIFSAYLGWLGAWLSVAQHLWRLDLR